jgi:phenylacetate-coenzyme A ligase PaaK-like adenylate-forming protein
MKKEQLMALYHRLPPAARNLAATVHGYRLRTWRFGPETEELVARAFERECWSPGRLRAWQEERLAWMLHHAATRVPYYRRYWERQWSVVSGQWSVVRKLPKDESDSLHPFEDAPWLRLENWPILEKEALRADPTAFLADGMDTLRMAKLHTSGTTGKPLDLWATRETERQWWALFDARWRRWYGVSRRDRWATIGGKIVAPVSQRRPPFWVWDASQSLLYMSTYHLAPDLVGSYLDALRRYRVRYVRGYASGLYILAQEALRLGRRDVKLEVAITYAEPLYPHQRQVIEEAFHCPVRETYGMVEMAAAASECEAGSLHLWPEAGWVEVLDGADRPGPAGTAGSLVCTGLLNADMPLIRYRVGDSGALAGMDASCPCGRTLPVLTSVEGRLDDVVYTRDGRRFGCLDVVHAGIPVREAQVIQESVERLRVRYVPAPEFTPATSREIVEELQSQMGEIDVVLEEVARIPRGPNGKVRMIVCNIPPEERSRLRGQPGTGAGHRDSQMVKG